MILKEPVLLLDYLRTPFGRFQGSLSRVHPSKMGAHLIKGLMERGSPDSAEAIEELFMGCVLSAGLGQSPARQCLTMANLTHLPGTIINKVCASGMYAAALGALSLQGKKRRMTLCGGMEAMSSCPYFFPKHPGTLGNVLAKDGMLWDGLLEATSQKTMGVIAEETAKKFEISRTVQDAYSYASATRALDGKTFFEGEILPFKTEKDSMLLVDEPLERVNREKIHLLKPAFHPEGTITAATSSALADGAACLLLGTHDTSSSAIGHPLAKLLGWSVVAGSPEDFITAPIRAVQCLLKKLDWEVHQVDAFEINEAFALVPLLSIQALKMDPEKINIYGGSCALGHPLAASGARILGTLARILKLCGGKKKGIAALCVGGGEGMAVALESL